MGTNYFSVTDGLDSAVTTGPHKVYLYRNPITFLLYNHTFMV